MLIVVIMMITNELIIKLKDRVIHIKLSCLLHVMGSALGAFVWHWGLIILIRN